MSDELIKWGGYIGLIAVSGISYFFPLRKKEIDTATSTLVKTLQENVDALTKQSEIHKDKISELEKNQENNILEITKIKEENKTLKDVLQGRDDDTKRFQEEGFKAIELIGQNFKLTEILSKDIGNLVLSIGKNNDMTAKFVETMEKHFLNVEKVAISK